MSQTEMFTVTGRRGAIVRDTAELDSEVLTEIAHGTVVLVDSRALTSKATERAHICDPAYGWISSKVLGVMSGGDAPPPPNSETVVSRPTAVPPIPPQTTTPTVTEAVQKAVNAVEIMTSATTAQLQTIGDTAVVKGDDVRAIAYFTRAFERSGECAKLLIKRAAAWLRVKQPERALEDAKVSLSTSPAVHRAHAICALALGELDSPEEAYPYWVKARELNAECGDTELRHAQCLKKLMRDEGRAARTRDALFARDAARSPNEVRVWCISDVHYDHEGAVQWAAGLVSDAQYRNDVLIVAGDVADTLHAVRLCLSAFKKAFNRVFYIPGASAFARY